MRRFELSALQLAWHHCAKKSFLGKRLTTQEKHPQSDAFVCVRVCVCACRTSAKEMDRAEAGACFLGASVWQCGKPNYVLRNLFATIDRRMCVLPPPPRSPPRPISHSLLLFALCPQTVATHASCALYSCIYTAAHPPTPCPNHPHLRLCGSCLHCSPFPSHSPPSTPPPEPRPAQVFNVLVAAAR